MKHRLTCLVWGLVMGWALVARGQEAVPVTVTVGAEGKEVAVGFLGLSYEMRSLLPENGKYYFDGTDENLVRVYKTLGVKSLRVGANAVDDPRVAVPGEKEIDALFGFAKAAGVKVIYSLRLKNGDPEQAGKIAAYINKNYRELLDCYSIGNEPDFYYKTYEEFRGKYRPIYEAVLKAVPDAKFDGPATSRKSYSLEFADEFAPLGHLKMVSTHTYALGNGREAEKDVVASRGRFVSNKTHEGYGRLYDGIVKPLEGKGIKYRMDETNSCFRGGAKDCSDTYASTLWVLDYLNWWAAKGIEGLNFHTGDTVNGFPVMVANYAVFIHRPEGSRTFEIRPVAYGLLAFSQVARGKSVGVKVEGAEGVDFAAYGYREGGATYLALLNKSYGEMGRSAEVKGMDGKWERMELSQEAGDIAAKEGVTLGGAEIDANGAWGGKWEAGDGKVVVGPGSAVLIRTPSR